MLTVTRIYNSASALSAMRRSVSLVRDYSSRRKIGRQNLNDMPLQVRVLANMELTHRGNLIFYLSIA